MMPRGRRAAMRVMLARGAVCLLAVLPACSASPGAQAAGANPDSVVLARRAARTAAVLTRSDSTGRDSAAFARWFLPKHLNEVSGLALTSDGRLLAIDDSHARVTEVDYRRGNLVKEFKLAPDPGPVDFEGIAVAGETLFLLASNGTLYETREGVKGGDVPFRVEDTGLGNDCEFEGVAFDAANGSLLLVCKVVKMPALRDSVVIYRWKLAAGGSRASRLSRLTVSSSAIPALAGKTMHPSDIAVDPASGHYVLISAREKVFVELTPAGEIVSSRRLTGQHPQAEGIAITKDGILIISDEAASGPAALTLYRRP